MPFFVYKSRTWSGNVEPKSGRLVRRKLKPQMSQHNTGKRTTGANTDRHRSYNLQFAVALFAVTRRFNPAPLVLFVLFVPFSVASKAHSAVSNWKGYQKELRK